MSFFVCAKQSRAPGDQQQFIQGGISAPTTKGDTNQRPQHSGTLSTQSTEEGWQLHRSPTAPWLPAMLSSRDNRGVSQATKRRKPDGVTTNTGPSVMLVGMLPALPSDSHPSWRTDGLGRLQRSVPTQGEGDTGFSQVSVCVRALPGVCQVTAVLQREKGTKPCTTQHRSAGPAWGSLLPAPCSHGCCPETSPAF